MKTIADIYSTLLSLEVTPGPDTVMPRGDRLVVMRPADQLRRLRAL